MEDNLQIILYVVFAIIYLIFNAFKKRQKGEEPAGPPPFFGEEEHRREADAEGPFRQEPASLEELLERYEQAAQRGKRRAAEKVETMQGQVENVKKSDDPGQPVYRNLEAEALEQMQRTERLKSMQDELPARARAEILESAPVRRRSAKMKAAPAKPRRLDENFRNRRDHKKRELPRMAEHIRALAGTRKGMQQAVILSEVLNRKYF